MATREDLERLVNLTEAVWLASAARMAELDARDRALALQRQRLQDRRHEPDAAMKFAGLGAASRRWQEKSQRANAQERALLRPQILSARDELRKAAGRRNAALALLEAWSRREG